MYRNVAKDGDIILFRGTGLLAKAIQHFDKRPDHGRAYYNHSAIVYWNRGRLEVLDAWWGGVTKAPMSDRIEKYSGGDFCVIRPLISSEAISSGITALNEYWHSKTPYHYAMLLRIALYKNLGWDLTRIKDSKGVVCSRATQIFAAAAGLQNYADIHLITPQDYLRFAADSPVIVLFDHSKDK